LWTFSFLYMCSTVVNCHFHSFIISTQLAWTDILTVSFFILGSCELPVSMFGICKQSVGQFGICASPLYTVSLIHFQLTCDSNSYTVLVFMSRSRKLSVSQIYSCSALVNRQSLIPYWCFAIVAPSLSFFICVQLLWNVSFKVPLFLLHPIELAILQIFGHVRLLWTVSLTVSFFIFGALCLYSCSFIANWFSHVFQFLFDIVDH
jgi:hypothetical protein